MLSQHNIEFRQVRFRGWTSDHCKRRQICQLKCQTIMVHVEVRSERLSVLSHVRVVRDIDFSRTPPSIMQLLCQLDTIFISPYISVIFRSTYLTILVYPATMYV